MKTKKKLSEAQGQALALGHRTLRRKYAEQRAVREYERLAALDKAEALASHLHGWKNWEYDYDTMTETRACRHCGATETRELSL